MPEILKRSLDGFSNPLLQMNVSGIGGPVAPRRGTAGMMHSRLISRLLRRHAEIDQVHQYLDMSLRLKISSHDPEGQNGATGVRHETGDNCVEGPFVRFQPVAILRPKRKRHAAVL